MKVSCCWHCSHTHISMLMFWHLKMATICGRWTGARVLRVAGARAVGCVAGGGADDGWSAAGAGTPGTGTEGGQGVAGACLAEGGSCSSCSCVCVLNTSCRPVASFSDPMGSLAGAMTVHGRACCASAAATWPLCRGLHSCLVLALDTATSASQPRTLHSFGGLHVSSAMLCTCRARAYTP